MSKARTMAAQALALRADQGQPLALWWRDDDAVQPSEPLDRLLQMTAEAGADLTLAVIPAPWDGPRTGRALAARLDDQPHVRVAVHGWSHQNHAAPGAKSQELAAHRPLPQMRDQLRDGLALLQDLHGPRALPLLVPPWNRIAPDLLPHLARDGFAALSTFGPETPVPGLAIVNTQLDVIDWHGGRSLRDPDALWRDLAQLAGSGRAHVGLLTHHLVHDAAIWDFLQDVIALAAQNGGQWRSVADLVEKP